MRIEYGATFFTSIGYLLFTIPLGTFKEGSKPVVVGSQKHAIETLSNAEKILTRR